MGNSSPHVEHLEQNQLNQMATLRKQYTPAFEKHRQDPQYFSKLMHQCPAFAHGLFKSFPKAAQDFEAFFEMVLFLRRQHAQFKVNEYAVANFQASTLLDRFYMLILGLSAEEFAAKEVSVEEMDQLLIHYFSIFIKEPSKGSIDKVLKEMHSEAKPMKAKEFSSKLREAYPRVQYDLKDYYLLKLNRMKQNGLLLKDFNSKILHNDAVLLALKVPRLVESDITSLYENERDGFGFHAIDKKILGYTGPWLLLVEHTEKDDQGSKHDYVFGAYQNGPIRKLDVHQGDVTGFMFRLHPTIKLFTPDMGDDEASYYFYINSLPHEVTKRHKGIGFGGNKDKQFFKLWIDEDIDESSVFNGHDPTYGLGSLASPGTQQLRIKRMEIWGLGDKVNLEEQEKYREERAFEIEKRRKVNKKQLVEGNAELFFQKNFEHRGQVTGQIEKKQDKKE